MILKTDYSALVLAGSWNKAIFNSDWISRFLLPKEKKLKIEFPVNVDGSHRVSTKQIRIFVIANKLNFAPLNTSNKTFELIQEIAIKTCDYLPHTPVTAFGINFIFESKYKKTNKALTKLLKIGDVDKLTAQGAQINQSQHKHMMETDGKNVNITVACNGPKINFHFNFHFELSTLSEFKEKIHTHSILSLKDSALNLMKDVYNLSLEKKG